jgi:hypothetical protein
MNDLMNVHYIPALASTDSTTTVTEAMTDAIDVGELTALHFVVNFGTITGDTLVVKLYKDINTTTSSGGTAIAFNYKLTSAVGTDVIGAWTASASTGYTVSAGADGMVLIVDVDPALCSGYPYVYLGIDPGASMTTLFYGVVAVCVPRFNQSIPPSAVD